MALLQLIQRCSKCGKIDVQTQTVLKDFGIESVTVEFPDGWEIALENVYCKECFHTKFHKEHVYDEFKKRS
jgi:hypothetical protein